MKAPASTPAPEAPPAPTVPAPRPWGRLIAVFVIQGVFLAIVLSLVARNPPPAWWIPGDGVDLPGAASAVSLRVARPDPLRGTQGVRGFAVEFFRLDGNEKETSLGGTATGDDGVARIAWTAPETPGLVRLGARAAAGSGAARMVPIVRAVAPAERPLVLVLVRGALRTVQVPLGGGEERFAIRAGAKEALATLADEATILYVATRGARAPDELRALLEEGGLPRGPLLYFPDAGDAETLGERLAASGLEHWKERAWGVCPRVAEARAFVRAGLRAVVLGADSTAGLPNVIAVSSWNGVAGAVLKRR